MNYYITGSFNIDPDTIPVTTSLQVDAEKGNLMMHNKSEVGLQNIIN